MNTCGIVWTVPFWILRNVATCIGRTEMYRPEVIPSVYCSNPASAESDGLVKITASLADAGCRGRSRHVPCLDDVNEEFG